MSSIALENGLKFVREVVAPRAQEIDQDSRALAEVMAEMGKRELMALKRPTEFGGPAMNEPDFRRFQEEAARASGTFAFLQTQHQSASSMISGSENDSLKSEYLPKMANGERMVGIGFSQLRRPGPPIMRAEKTTGGYRLDGKVPWVTGWSVYPEFLIGAALPDGQAVFAVAPLKDAPGVRVSPPMRLAAMEAAMTVSVDFDAFEVPDSKVAYIRPAGWIANSDMINIALQGHFAIGCALAGLDIVEAAYTRRQDEEILRTRDSLRAELEQCRLETAEAQRLAGEETTDERLRVRAWAIDLAFRCAQAGVVCSSGAANSLAHPAQRVYREALVYSVSAQTTAIMSATLTRFRRDETL